MFDFAAHFFHVLRYAARGAAATGAGEEDQGAQIKKPFQGQPYAQCQPFTPCGPLSENQQQAVLALLSYPVAYVWWPPGTGKTKHVLAETVRHLMLAGKKVLVSAATNAAVENALEAILSLPDVEPTDVLRIGIPSNKFYNQWPQSCEAQGLKNKPAMLKADIATLVNLIEDAERKTLLEPLLPNNNPAQKPCGWPPVPPLRKRPSAKRWLPMRLRN